MSIAKGEGGLRSEVEELKEKAKEKANREASEAAAKITSSINEAQKLSGAVSSAVSSIDTSAVTKAGEDAIGNLTNSLETSVGSIAGEIEGGVQSLTSEFDKLKGGFDKLTTKEGLLDAGAQSLENLKSDLISGAAAALSSKFGATVSVTFTEPDSNGQIWPISSSLEEDGGVSGTVAAVIKLITGLIGVDAGALQKAVVDASPEGLMSAAGDLDIQGKIGAFTSEGIGDAISTAVTSVTDQLEATVTGTLTDVNKPFDAITSFDPSGLPIKTTLNSTGPSAEAEFSLGIQNIKNSITDVKNLATKAKEVKQNVKDLTDIENLTGGKNPKEVIESVNSAALSRVKFTEASEKVNSIIQTRIAKGGEVGIVQSFSKELLTDVNNQVKAFASKLSDEEIERVINLSQGDAQDQSDAIRLLSDRSGKSYNEIKSFIKTIDTTITSSTKPVPSEFIFEEPYVIGSYEKQWSNGQGDPVFPYISSIEEMQAEMKNITREVTEVVVHWTETPTNKNIGSEELNKIHLESGLNGIGYHYVIRRDGSLQRGRPINIQGDHALLNNHDERSIGIVFVGGINAPSGTPNLENFVSVQSLTRSQFNTFDHFCRSFYARFPGGQILGHNDVDPREYDPGFNVREYVAANFDKQSKFTNPQEQSPFTIDEINNDE